MPATAEDIARVREQRERASALGFEAAKLGAGARTFESRIMEGVRGRRAERGVTTLEEAVGYTTGQLATAPAEMRARLAEVSPLQADVLTARQTAQTLGTLATLGEVEEARAGTIEEAIGAGTGRLLAQADLKRAEAERAAGEAETLASQIDLQERAERWEFEEWEARERLKLARQQEARLGRQGEGADFSSLQELFFGEGKAGVPTESEPMYTPAEEGSVSDEGEWIYSGGQWVPTGGGMAGTFLQALDGTIYQYDSSIDPDYLEDLGKGFIPWLGE